MKLTKELGHISIDTLDQDDKLHTKEYFNLWTDNSSFSNVNKSFSFHIDKKIHKEATCQALLRTLWLNDLH